jgi:hypothetical protein
VGPRPTHIYLRELGAEVGRMGAKVIRVAAIVAVVSAAYATASSLGGITANSLGAGGATVQSCDSDGLSIAYTTSAGKVTEVAVSGISPSCNGGQLSVTLINSSSASIGTGGPQVVSATSHTIGVPAQPDATLVTGAHMVITGP